MKPSSILRYLFIIIILFALDCIDCPVIAQANWYKYPGESIHQGAEKEWQSRRSKKAIIYESGQYKMWYSTFNTNGVNILGYATSIDGFTWASMESDSVDFECVEESWDSRFGYFDILKTDTAYFMWFTMKVNINNGSCLGFAWSKNGKNWIRYPEPVLTNGEDDAWDARGPRGLSVMFKDNYFHLYYGAYDRSRPAIERIGMAISTDGILWEKHPANPLLSEGEPGSWDDHGVDVSSVVFNGSGYDMWYSGNDLIRTQIGQASSNNGIDWTRSSENPVLENGEPGERDCRYIHSPEVLYRDSVCRMWYNKSDNYRNFYGYATTSVDEYLAWDSARIGNQQREIRAEVFGRVEYVKIDSLTGILYELSGNDLIDAYNRLAIAYSQNDPIKSLNFANKALLLANQVNYPEGRAMAFYSKGNREFLLDNYGGALTNYLSSLRIYDSLDMMIEKGDLLLWIATINSHVGSMEIQCSYAKEALEAYEHISDTGFILYSLNYLGYAYLNNEDTTNAIKTFERKLRLERNKRNTWAQANNYNALALCYSGRSLDSALHYSDKVIEIYDSIKSDPGFWTYSIIADAYFAAGPDYYERAEEYYLKCYDRYWIGSQPGEVGLLNAIAELYLITGQYDKCRQFLDVSLRMSQLWLSKLEHHLFIQTGKIYNEWLLKSNREKVYRLYYRLDTTLNDEHAAFKHYKLATQWKDSVYNEQNREKWEMKQAEYESAKTHNQVALLEKNNEVKNLTLKKTRNYLFALGALVIIIVLAAILFFRNRKIKVQHALEVERLRSGKLLEIDRLKSRFFTNISHEFRTPLTLIMGPLDRILSKSENDNDKRELEIAKKYTRNLQRLINNLLSISKLEAGKMVLFASELDIVKLINTYIHSFESLAKQNNIELKFNSDIKKIPVFIDQEKFEQILNNLLSNAFKFTGDGGRIEVGVHSQQSTVQGLSDGKAGSLSARDSVLNEDWRLKTEDLNSQWVGITISDTGRGISPNHLPHIFDRLYQVEEENSYYEGTGIGLALTKELVELHHGNITVLSEPGKGSIFTILLPLGNDHLKPEEIIVEKPDERSSIPLHDVTPDNEVEDPFYGESIVDNNKDQSILLIVDDNVDMRSYIRSYFENEYNIIEAVNGAEGYDVSTQHIPDIIISDVMMPTMDGNEFCRKIKADERTSHIPVILLTARASRESRMEGLETGADDFISKPFDGEELKLRVKNLVKHQLRIRKLLEQKIQKSKSIVQIDFADSSITSSDEQFLQKVIEIVKEHYTDPQFNINKLGQDIGLGRIQLNRKIKALTGQTTVSFIRAFRLNRAAELIKKESATVAEIAYDVGFSSPSYFSECFRLYFGSLPSDFNKKE